MLILSREKITNIDLNQINLDLNYKNHDLNCDLNQLDLNHATLPLKQVLATQWLIDEVIE